MLYAPPSPRAACRRRDRGRSEERARSGSRENGLRSKSKTSGKRGKRDDSDNGDSEEEEEEEEDGKKYNKNVRWRFMFCLR